MKNLIFLKLGGSVITDKDNTSTSRPKTIARLAKEIATAYQENPNLKIIIGHGSGSFGHKAASKYGTREGVSTADQWRGFQQVWLQASQLNRILIHALHHENLPAISFPLSAGAITENREIQTWNLDPLISALNNNLLPVVYGDVCFDTKLGGTILSTEEIFYYLASQISPKRILIAGIEEGVWVDYPDCTKLANTITPSSYAEFFGKLGGSQATDVTGGMASKVEQMLLLKESKRDLEICIFSGSRPGLVKEAILGASPGTRILFDE